MPCIAEQKEKALKDIIDSENLNEEKTRKFISDSFERSSVKTTVTDIDKLMPPTSGFDKGNHDQKRKTVVEKI